MSIFGKTKSSSRGPTERSVIEKSVIVDLWVDENRERIRWSLSRVNPESEKGFRTLKAENLAEAVKALSALARVFSAFEGTKPSMQRFYAELSVELDELMARVAEQGDTSSGSGSSGLLSAAGI